MADPWTPIARPDAVSLIKETVRGAIARGEYGPGDTLPSERLLAQQLAVSRSSLRAALLELRTEGYLVAKVGLRGGNSVTNLIQPASSARAAARSRPQRFAELMEFRAALECEAARLAARRATARHIVTIEESIDAMARPASSAVFRRADHLFHATIAAAARNDRLGEAILHSRNGLFLMAGNIGELIVETSLAAHRRIAAAIAAADADAAEQAMRSHLEESARELLPEAPGGPV